MDVWEERYNELKYDYRKLQNKYDELKEKYDKVDSDLYSANFKIRNELEPRIESEKRAYDLWVTNPQRR